MATPMNRRQSFELNRDYYKCMLTRDNLDKRVKVYATHGSPVVLYNLDDSTPLLSIHFVNTVPNPLNATSPKSVTMLTEREDSHREGGGRQRFQGMINKDHQRVGFFIHNLTTTGAVDVNFFYDNEEEAVNCKEIEPPKRLNSINELRPFESYLIEADLQADNRSIVLSAFEDRRTVAEDEQRAKETGKKPESTRFFVSVVPHANVPGHTERFANTVWHTADYIVLEDEKPAMPIPYYGAPGQLRLASRTLESVRPLGGPVISAASSSFSVAQSFDDSDDDVLGYASAAPAYQNPYPGEPRDLFRPAGVDKSLVTTTHPRGPAPKQRADKLVANSLATKLTHGEQLEVTPYASYAVYDFTKNSVCEIGLSVEKSLENYNAEFDADLKFCTELIESFISKRIAEEFLNTRVFTESACVVCQDDESPPPNIIFYGCGHAVCHKDCAGPLLSARAPRCPMCRGNIVATMPYESQAV